MICLAEKYEVFLVGDATKPVLGNRAKELLKPWRSVGVKIINTKDVLKGVA